MQSQATTDSLLEQAEIHAKEGSTEKAAEYFAEALKHDPHCATAYCRLGDIYRAVGSHEKAIPLYEKALEIDPQSVRACYGLGDAHSSAGQEGKGLHYFRQVLALEPKHESALFKVGSYYNNKGLIDKAEPFFQQMQQAAPENPLSYFGLASIAIKRMDREKAEEYVKQGLETEPDHAALLRQLAVLESMAKDYKKAETTIRRSLELQRDDLSLIQGYSELGTILDKQGRYDDAYDAFCEMQHLRTSCRAAQRYKATEVLIEIDHYAALINDKKKLPASPPPQDGLPAPIFLVGFPRSGTTLLQQMLGSHPAIFARDENSIIGRISRSGPLGGKFGAEYPKVIPMLSPENATVLRKLYYYQLIEAYGDEAQGRCYLDKVPYNLIHLPLIERMFPEARIITIIRDPRDACLSSFMQHFTHSHASMNFRTLEMTAGFYAKMMELWLLYKDALPLKMTQIRYEDLVENPEHHARELIDFLGYDWDPAVLEFYKDKNRAISTPNAEGIKSPIHKKSKARWKHYEKQMTPVLPVLQPFMDAFGYE